MYSFGNDSPGIAVKIENDGSPTVLYAQKQNNLIVVTQVWTSGEFDSKGGELNQVYYRKMLMMSLQKRRAVWKQ
jgi:hypothetical protein